MSTNLSVGIIGAGPGGLALGILLSRAGFNDFTIFDREDDVGGTWRINTYPGLACDVKSHLYSFSFDLNPNWSRLWSGQPEILAYFERCADKYGLRPHLKLRTEIRSARWDEDTQLWYLTTTDGTQHHFNIVVSAVGLFTRPLLPDLVEQEPFTGRVIHSASWDHSVSLEGARVAVLGTGSTASQLLPEIAKIADTVYSVQRSPTWILPKPDRHYTRRERWIFAHVPFAKKLYRTRLWLRSESNISVIEHGSEKTQDFTAIALGLLEKTVADEELRRKLTPDHPMGCKRLVFSSDYLPALTRPNVEVLNSPARYLKARSLVTEDGTEREVDAVVCATGYAAADYLGQLDVSGELGNTLRQVWSEGATAYFGMVVPGFPNFFMLYGPNSQPLSGGVSLPSWFETWSLYAIKAVVAMIEGGYSQIEVRKDVYEEYNERLHETASKLILLRDEGSRERNYYVNEWGRLQVNAPFETEEYFRMCKEPDLDEFVLS